MYHKRTNRLVEICPQCCRGIDKSTSRLVSDYCGHSKCRVCLLQEINGCLKCAAETQENRAAPSRTPLPQPLRKSVITSTLDLKRDQADKNTCQIFKESLKNEILFPKEIVKESASNFYHLKRLISKRFFSEKDSKVDKSCETDKSPTNVAETQPKLPDHIQYFCNVHKLSLTDDEKVEQHMGCSPENYNIYKCKECNRAFPTATKLKRHSRCHAPPSHFECNVCQKKFKDNYALTTHSRKHTGDKVFCCSLCNAQFSQLWSLKRHIAKHKGELNFACEICKRRFLTKPELNRHQVTHTKTKPFICRTCGASFTFRRSLARHQTTHTGDPPVIQCHKCQSTFKRKDNLHRHLRNTHGDQVSAME